MQDNAPSQSQAHDTLTAGVAYIRVLIFLLAH